MFHCSHLPPGFQTQNLQARWHNLALLLVIGSGDTFKGLEAVHSFSSTGKLMGEHTTHHTPEDLAWGTEMVGSTFWVGVHTLAQELQVLHCNR